VGIERDTDENLDWKEVLDASDFAIEKLAKDLRNTGMEMGPEQARFFVENYYRLQEDRIRYKAQVRELTKQDQPNELLDYFGKSFSDLEKMLQSVLDVYSKSNPVGRWMRSVTGVGPVIAAGFMAHLSLEPDNAEPIQYVGQWWSFAGLNPGVEWEKGQKRPWNTKLKTLCYKLGESFVKVQNNKNDFYGKLFAEQKRRYWEKNLNGEYSDAALKNVIQKNIGKSTAAYAWYSGKVDPEWARERLKVGRFPTDAKGFPKTDAGTPMLPPAHIHARARRWVAKLFLSHLFEVWYVTEKGHKPPEPFVLTMENHNRKIEVPFKDDF